MAEKRSRVEADIALLVMPVGSPLAHEVPAGNDANKTMSRDFLARIVKGTDLIFSVTIESREWRR